MEQEKEERHCNPLTAIIALEAQRPIPDHPPYAEMVQMALRFLSDPGGSTESAISNYIVAAYTDLPPGHARLLPYYLNKLVATGDITASSPGRYVLPPPPESNPNPNPRRRGRPPKNNPRPSGRGRGRPRKNPETASKPAPTRPKLVIRLRRKTPNPEVGDGSGGAAGRWALVGYGLDGEKGGENGVLSKSKVGPVQPFGEMPLWKPFEQEFEEMLTTPPPIQTVTREEDGLAYTQLQLEHEKGKKDAV